MPLQGEKPPHFGRSLLMRPAPCPACWWPSLPGILSSNMKLMRTHAPLLYTNALPQLLVLSSINQLILQRTCPGMPWHTWGVHILQLSYIACPTIHFCTHKYLGGSMNLSHSNILKHKLGYIENGNIVCSVLN